MTTSIQTFPHKDVNYVITDFFFFKRKKTAVLCTSMFAAKWAFKVSNIPTKVSKISLHLPMYVFKLFGNYFFN